MTPLCLVTQAYYAANMELIHSLAAQGGNPSFAPVPEGVLIHCRGVDPSLLPAADVYTLPLPLQDEGEANYRARIATAAVGAFNAVKNGPKEVFYFQDGENIHDCRAATGWPQNAPI